MVRLASLLSLGLLACSPPAGRDAARPPPRAPATPAASVAPSPSIAPPTSASAAPPPVPVAELPSAPLLPTGFVAVPEPNLAPDASRVACGAFSIENAPSASPNNYEPFVRAYDKAGKKIYEAHGRTYELDAGISVRQSLVADVCGDLTGDGIPELILTERTMGAHCCYTHYIVSLTTPAKRLLMWEKGDSGDGMLPIRFSKSGPWQVISYARIYPPFDPEKGEPTMVYAGVPGYPIVFDYVGGEYKPRTFSFREGLRSMRQEDRAACAALPDCEPSPFYEWGLALIIGDWETEKAKLIPDAEEREPFERRAKEFTAALRRALGP
ncbi:MAG: hypothetical protein JNL21_38005 [Myxococcales bacterium]|nr:hypothetical protein [Myxococcales bacterium]